MAHRQHTENKPAIKVIVQACQLVLYVGDTPIHLCHQAGLSGGGQGTQLGEHLELLAQCHVPARAGDLVGHPVQTGKCRGKDDPRLVGQRLGQHPALGQVGALAGRAIAHDQWDACIAQSLDPGRDRELGRDVQRLDACCGHAKLTGQIKVATPPRQLDRICGIGDHLKRRTSLALDQAIDALFRHLGAEAIGNQLDELLAAQETIDVLVVENLAVLSGQAKGRAADDDRSGHRHFAAHGRGAYSGHERGAGTLVDVLSLFQELGKELPQGQDTAVLGRTNCPWGRTRRRCGRCCRRD